MDKSWQEKNGTSYKNGVILYHYCVGKIKACSVVQYMQIPERTIIPRQEDMSQKVIGSNPSPSKGCFYVKYLSKFTCVII